MEPLRDDQLIADLQALRPTPRPQFAAELDERVAAGFPRRSRLPRLSFGRLLALPLRRQLIAAGGLAVLLIAIAGVLGVVSREDSSPSPESGLLSLTTEAPDDAESSGETSGTASAAESEALPSEGLSEEKSGAVVAPLNRTPHAGIRHRDVERSASLT
ncbi:MAG TPA: hypothetical protein VNN15_01280, partial [Solirubrobacterales bacterium]|nr:hypothetical protein [Solirubrobacterales bacterium]